MADFNFDLSPNALVSSEIHNDEMIVGVRVSRPFVAERRDMICTFTGEVDNDMSNPANWKDGRMPGANEYFAASTAAIENMPRTRHLNCRCSWVDASAVAAQIRLDGALAIPEAARETLGDEWDGIDLRLVGVESDGEVKPIDELRYNPALYDGKPVPKFIDICQVDEPIIRDSREE